MESQFSLDISEHQADVLELVSRGTYDLPSKESVYLMT